MYILKSGTSEGDQITYIFLTQGEMGCQSGIKIFQISNDAAHTEILSILDEQLTRLLAVLMPRE